MPVFHVAVRCRADSADGPAAPSPAHDAQLGGWRDDGRLVGGGPAPDGRTCDFFWRAGGEDELERLLAEDRFVRDGRWAAYTLRRFADFVEPLEVPRLDPTRRAVLVAGRAGDAAAARRRLVDMRDAARIAFGGLFDGGDTLALALTTEPALAVRWFTATGVWAPRGLKTRPLHYLL